MSCEKRFDGNQQRELLYAISDGRLSFRIFKTSLLKWNEFVFIEIESLKSHLWFASICESFYTYFNSDFFPLISKFIRFSIALNPFE